MGPKLSVVMPAYNAERYLEESLDSALGQTFDDFELVVVDDGSTDSTPEILARYAAVDARMRVIRQENGGSGKAMNTGIDHAIGDYVAILESDDLMMPEMLETLYRRACETDADVVRGDYWTFTGEGESRSYTYMQACPDRRFYGPVHDSTTTTALYYPIPMNWQGIYRRSFLNERSIRHSESPGAAFQDNGFWFQTLAWAKRVVYVHRALYCYRVDNPGASTKATDLKQFYAMRGEYDFIRRFLESNPEQYKRLYMTYLHFRLDNLVARFFAAAPDARPEMAQVIRDELREAMRYREFSWNRFGTSLALDLKAILRDPADFAAHPLYNINDLCWNEVAERVHRSVDYIDPNLTTPAWLVAEYLDALDIEDGKQDEAAADAASAEAASGTSDGARADDELQASAGLLSCGRQLCRDVLTPQIARSWELVTARDVSTAEVGERAICRVLEETSGDPSSRLLHDRHHAPYVATVYADGTYDADLYSEDVLISITDEDAYACALAAVPSEGSRLAGVGIDLANTRDFRLDCDYERFYRFLFTDNELRMIERVPEETRPVLATSLFSIKEAAVKSVAPLVRRYEATHATERMRARLHDLEVLFDGDVRSPGDFIADAHRGEVRCFGLTGEHMELIGMSRIRVGLVPGRRYVFAVAICEASLSVGERGAASC